MSLQKKWKQQAASSSSTGGGSASPRHRKIRNRGCTQSEAWTPALVLTVLAAAALTIHIYWSRCRSCGGALVYAEDVGTVAAVCVASVFADDVFVREQLLLLLVFLLTMLKM
jgi:hypothetical protein